jgi:arylsulfatase A-like enzyme
VTPVRTAIRSTALGLSTVMLAACWLEGAFGRFALGVWGLLSSGLLAIGLGALAGGALGALAGWSARKRWRGGILSLLLGAVIFWRVATDLRLLAIGRGFTHAQAQMVLAVCGVTAVGAACILGALLVGFAHEGRVRLVAGLGLGLMGVLTRVVDPLLAFDNYALVHWFIRAETFAACGAAVALLGPLRTFERLRVAHVAALAVGGLGLSALAFQVAPGTTALALLDHGLSRFVLENARALTDWDRDGYSGWFGGGDCAPWSSAVNPGQRDIPGNGVDDNCHGGDAKPANVAAPAMVPGAPATPPPSIVLITAEALRIDHLSLYGYARDTTPELSRWAKTAWRFDQTVSWTRTGLSMPSLFYGRLPMRLSWGRRVDTTAERLVAPEALAPGELARRVLPAAIRQPFLALPGLLHQRGLRTFAVVDDGLSPYLVVQPGYAEQFDDYYTVRAHGGGLDDRDTATLAQNSLADLAQGGPFFLWVHFFGTHAPSTEHWGLPKYGTDVGARYDHEIGYLDRELSPLLAKLDALSQSRPLVVLFVADHGESLGTLDRDHGLNVDEANLHVPLLLKAPGLGSGVSRALVSQADIAPTLLAFAGVSSTDMDGLDLRQIIATGGDPNRIVLSAAWAWNFDFRPVCSMIAAVGFGQKATYDRLREARFVTRFGDFRETPLPPDAHSRALLDSIDGYLDRYGPVTPR